MITNIKMEVTPELRKRVLEIVSANKGNWITEADSISHKEGKYIYVAETLESFNLSKFKEISAYDFIASQGEQEWLPKYGEKILIGHSLENMHKDIFIAYNPSLKYPFLTKDAAYEYCKPLPKEVSFIQFLKDNNAYEAYMKNTKIENQRCPNGEAPIKLEDLKKLEGYDWIIEAFNWDRQKEGEEYWSELNYKWDNYYAENDVEWGGSNEKFFSRIRNIIDGYISKYFS